MTKHAVKAAIDAAFARLVRATESSSEASKLLHAALEAATAGEKGHRRFVGSQYRASVATAARYFVCKWFNEPAKVTDALAACMLRTDCLHASALRQLLNERGVVVDMTGISDINYCEHIAAREA